MIFHDLLTYRQTNAGTFISRAVMQSLKYLKNAVFVLRIKPYSIIGERNVLIMPRRVGTGKRNGRTRHFAATNLDHRCSLGADKFERICDQVHKQLLKLVHDHLPHRKHVALDDGIFSLYDIPQLLFYIL